MADLLGQLATFAAILKPKEPLGPFTQLKIGGPAEVLAQPRDQAELTSLFRFCLQKNIPVRVLGAGANLLIREEGVRGVVLRLTAPAFCDIRVKGNMRSNSADFVRVALMQGLGLALRATWDIGPELERGELTMVLPEYRGSSKNGIYAVYPCREFMPSKVNAFIEYFADVFDKTDTFTNPLPVDATTAATSKPSRRSTGKAA